MLGKDVVVEKLPIPSSMLELRNLCRPRYMQGGRGKPWWHALSLYEVGTCNQVGRKKLQFSSSTSSSLHWSLLASNDTQTKTRSSLNVVKTRTSPIMTKVLLTGKFKHH